MTRLLTPEEAAERLAVKRSRVIAMARGGGLPSIRLGREWRFPEAALDAWIERQTDYTPSDGEAATPRQRRRVNLPRARSKEAVGRADRRRLDAGGPSDQAGALRIVGAGGQELAR